MLKCAEGALRVPVASIRGFSPRGACGERSGEIKFAWVQGTDQMKFTMMALTLCATLGAGASWADPPKTIRVTETVEIKAPIDKVWATVKDFDSLKRWHPGFASDELVSGGNG